MTRITDKLEQKIGMLKTYGVDVKVQHDAYEAQWKVSIDGEVLRTVDIHIFETLIDEKLNEFHI